MKDNYITLYPDNVLGFDLELAGNKPEYEEMQENTVYIYLEGESLKWAVRSQNFTRESFDLAPLDNETELSLKEKLKNNSLQLDDNERKAVFSITAKNNCPPKIDWKNNFSDYKNNSAYSSPHARYREITDTKTKQYLESGYGYIVNSNEVPHSDNMVEGEIYVYPGKETWEYSYKVDDQRRTATTNFGTRKELTETEEEILSEQIIKEISNYSAVRFIKTVSNQDPDHDNLHYEDGFNEDNEHFHLEFEKITPELIPDILDIFVDCLIISRDEKNSFITAYNMENPNNPVPVVESNSNDLLQAYSNFQRSVDFEFSKPNLWLNTRSHPLALAAREIKLPEDLKSGEMELFINGIELCEQLVVNPVDSTRLSKLMNILEDNRKTSSSWQAISDFAEIIRKFQQERNINLSQPTRTDKVDIENQAQSLTQKEVQSPETETGFLPVMLDYFKSLFSNFIGYSVEQHSYDKPKPVEIKVNHIIDLLNKKEAQKPVRVQKESQKPVQVQKESQKLVQVQKEPQISDQNTPQSQVEEEDEQPESRITPGL